MATLKIRFDGRVFVPEQPVQLPVGQVLEIALPAPEAGLARLAGMLDQLPANPDWPEDGAAQHDHYLYGTPKAP